MIDCEYSFDSPRKVVRAVGLSFGGNGIFCTDCRIYVLQPIDRFQNQQHHKWYFMHSI